MRTNVTGQVVRKCKDCGETKPFARGMWVWQEKRGAYGKVCLQCTVNRRAQGARAGRTVDSDPHYRSEKSKMTRLYLRRKIILAYGSRCACCGEREQRFMTLDHVHNDGADHRRFLAEASGSRASRDNTAVYRDVIRRGYPDTFQLLCWNCNCAKGMYGICPHETERQARLSRRRDNS
jgi:hypothetical protein